MLVSSINTWVLDFRFYATNVHLGRIFVSTPSCHHHLCTVRIKLKQRVSLKWLEIVYPEERFCQLRKVLLEVISSIGFFCLAIYVFDLVILSGGNGSIVCIFDWLIINSKFLVMQGMRELM